LNFAFFHSGFTQNTVRVSMLALCVQLARSSVGGTMAVYKVTQFEKLIHCNLFGRFLHLSFAASTPSHDFSVTGRSYSTASRPDQVHPQAPMLSSRLGVPLMPLAQFRLRDGAATAEGGRARLNLRAAKSFPLCATDRAIDTPIPTN
jgi:hypothetical protein